MKESKSNSLDNLGDEYEIRSFLFIKRVTNRLLDSFFHFKKRKGEIVAGGATFFTLLSFTPILLLLVSATGAFMGDVVSAKAFVLDSIKENFPQLAPWILNSVEGIVDSQLRNASGFNLINGVVLFYASLGVISSLMFGLNTIAKKEAKGGFYLEDVKSIFTGLFVSGFILGLLALSNSKFMLSTFHFDHVWANSAFKTIVDYNLLPVSASLIFFTLFYQFAVPRQSKWKDSFLGASAFVGCFLAGKSFYWIYLLYSKDGLTQSFGSFYSIFIAVFWVYFLMCSFFYGAAVSSLRLRDVYGDRVKKRVSEPHSVQEMPEEDHSHEEAA